MRAITELPEFVVIFWDNIYRLAWPLTPHGHSPVVERRDLNSKPGESLHAALN